MPTTLPTVVIVVALLGFAATAVRPSIDTSDLERLNGASHELAELIRFAARESHRTGNTYGVIFDNATSEFSVVEADMTTEPFGVVGVAYHPLKKQPYTWRADNSVSIAPSASPFDYGAHGTSDRLAFDNWGTPFTQIGGVNRLLITSQITLASSNHSKVIEVSRLSGRVTVQ